MKTKIFTNVILLCTLFFLKVSGFAAFSADKVLFDKIIEVVFNEASVRFSVIDKWQNLGAVTYESKLTFRKQLKEKCTNQ